MSSNESDVNEFVPLNEDPELLSAFEATGYKDAAKLRNAGRYKVGSKLNSTGYENVLKSQLTSNAGPSTTLDLFGSPSGFSGDNLDAVYAAYDDWKKKYLKTKEDHDQYVKLSQERPGRAATILTGMSGPESKTVLGAPITSGKTVI